MNRVRARRCTPGTARSLRPANPGNPMQCLATPGCGPFNEVGARGPFNSHFDAVSYQETMGNSNYNALEVNLRHNSGPLEFLVGYTYSKSIDQSSSLAEPGSARRSRPSGVDERECRAPPYRGVDAPRFCPLAAGAG
jgi:hypothetical protein